MSQALPFFLESLQVKFLHIRSYDLSYTWSGKGRQLPHSVLWFVDDGEFLLEIDHISLQPKSGDLCLLPAGSIVSYKATSPRLRLVSVNFDAVIPFLKSRSWIAFIRIPLYVPQVRSDIEPYLLDMLSAVHDAPAGQSLLLQADLLRILFCLLQKQPPWTPEAASRSMDTRILAILHYVVAHPGHIPTVEELAQLIQISPSHLRKLFDEHLGLSPLAFVHQLKIEHAKKELESSEWNISDIAYRLGFPDPNYFTRLFKRKTGLTPRQFRDQYRLFDL